MNSGLVKVMEWQAIYQKLHRMKIMVYNEFLSLKSLLRPYMFQTKLNHHQESSISLSCLDPLIPQPFSILLFCSFQMDTVWLSGIGTLRIPPLIESKVAILKKGRTA